MKKALLSILCLLAVLLTAAAVTASAADVSDSGTCGEVTWTLDRDGTLTLSGSGSTKYFMEPGQWPWDPYHDQIRSVVVQDGVQIGRIFEDFCRTAVKNKNELRTILPERADFAEVYRYLRSQGEFHHKPEHMVHVFGNRISYGKIRVILEAMKQLGLIEFAEGIKSSRISLLSVSGRVDLETADIIRKIREALQ